MIRAAVLLVIVASCSKSKDTPPPGAAAASKPGAAASASGGLTADVDVCGLMPAATIAQITGKTFTEAKEDDTKSYRLYACRYAGPNPLSISIVGLHGKPGYGSTIEALKGAGQAVVDVPGIGDAAFSSNSQLARLEVLYGDVTIAVTDWADLPLDQAKQIASQLHDKMTAK